MKAEHRQNSRHKTFPHVQEDVHVLPRATPHLGVGSLFPWRVGQRDGAIITGKLVVGLAGSPSSCT